MIYLIAGLVLFTGIHSLRLFAPGIRQSLMTALGRPLWFSIHGLVSVLSIILIAKGYADARFSPVWLWYPPLWLNHVTLLLMLFSFVLLVGGLVPHTHFRRYLRAPVAMAIILWALAHLLSNPTLADILLFGSLLTWALLLQRDAVHGADRRPATACPFRTLLATVVALGAYVLVLLWLHPLLIGVSPLSGM